MNTKTTIYPLALLLLVISCQSETEIDYVILSGHIANTTSSYITIKNNGYSSDFDINVDGAIYDTLRTGTGYYTLFIGRIRTPIYLQVGNNLTLNVDYQNFDGSITFSGAGGQENNYLTKKLLTSTNEDMPFTELYSKEEVEFASVIANKEKKHLALLKNASLVNEKFVELEKKVILYTALTSKANFEYYHQYTTKIETYKVSDDFLDDLKAINLDDSIEFETMATFRQLVNGYFSTHLMNRDVDEIFKQIRTFQSTNIKEHLASKMRYEIKPGNEDAEKIYDGIVSITKNPMTLQYTNMKIDRIRKLGIGMPSPSFDYQSITGDQVSLDDLKGKFLYVDVWATWCGPCIREIPSLKILEEDYQDKNVTFVSISIDSEGDFEKWQKMIADKALGGTQLFADNSWKSDFMQAYAIDAIPRFIIIDPKGNIVNPNAKRPSNPKLREFFEQL